jgi:peptidyl-prolyl cis-trans isomerase SurA
MSLRPLRRAGVALSIALRSAPLVVRGGGLALAGSALLFAVPARATVVERIVAVVGDQPILLSELRHRARPALVRIYEQVPVAQQKVAEAEMYKELLTNMINERLIALAADKLNVTVTTKEVDDQIKLRAADLKMQVAELVAEANRMGFSEDGFRDEIRREILYHKMLETRVRSRVRVTDDDVNDFYKNLQAKERAQQPFRASEIVIDLPTGPGGEKARLLADALVKSARTGYDFATLARKYSIAPSREKGGDLGTKMPGGYGKLADEAVLRLDVGQVSEPLVVGATLVIVKVTQRAPSQIPPLDEVKDLIFRRVAQDQEQKQVKLWLDELKQGVYIDVRL